MDDEGGRHYAAPLWRPDLRQMRFSFSKKDRDAILKALGQEGRSDYAIPFLETVEDRVATYSFLAEQTNARENQSEVKRQLKVLRRQVKAFSSKLERIPYDTGCALDIAFHAPPPTRNLFVSLSDHFELLDQKLALAHRMIAETAKPGKPVSLWQHCLIRDVLAVYKSCFDRPANVRDQALQNVFHRILESAGFQTRDVDIQPLLDAAAAEVNT